MRIVVHQPLREAWTALPAQQTSIECDELTFVVDEHTLPRQLIPLVPSRSARCAPEEWRPFCVMARTMGLL
jgi:hypothetical protein